jgi:hypothetical protein
VNTVENFKWPRYDFPGVSCVVESQTRERYRK